METTVKFGFFAHIGMIGIVVFLFFSIRSWLRKSIAKSRYHNQMISRFVGDGRNGADVFLYYLKHMGSAEISNGRGMWGFATIKGDWVGFGFRYNAKSGSIKIALLPKDIFEETFLNVSSRNKAWHALYELLRKIEAEEISAVRFEKNIYSISVASSKIFLW